MNHEQRVTVYKQYMAEAGADLNAAAPALWEFAWSRGWEVPPPPFMSGPGLVLFGAIAYPALALLLWLVFTVLRPMHGVPFSFAMWVAVAAGLFGAIATPMFCRRMARKYGLVHWSTFRGIRQRA